MTDHRATVGRRAVLGAGAVGAGAIAFGIVTRSGGGDGSPRVEQAQRELNDQGYYCGSPDGRIGELTTCAILAYQKAHHLTVDGILDDEVIAALHRSGATPRFTHQGSVVEVDLKRQLVRIVSDGRVEVTLHASTGTDQVTSFRRRKVLSSTPEGRFRLRPGTEDGTVSTSLGELYRPHFFTGQYGIYGRSDLASVRKRSTLGGVAVPSGALRWLEQNDHLPRGRLVVVA